MVAVATTDNVIACPTWQFLPDGSVLDSVAVVLRALEPAGWSALTTALWFMGHAECLDGLSAAEWLREGRPIEPVLAAARRDVATWIR